ncbi:MAG: ACP S-malonyltransferase [Firmicutes bacterium]|nr:ACP S-malonyltransferase [Bacillota bacterium]
MLEKCFLFEGQGEQRPGMGNEIFKSYFAAREVFDLGSKITGVDLRRLCFETDADELNKADNSQLAIFTLSMAIFNAVKQEGFTPSYYAGFSLGECSALCAAGVFSLEDGFNIIKKRGELMHQCAQEKKGAMYAIIGLEDFEVERICAETKGFVAPANYNCPLQLVISGDADSAYNAAHKCMEQGAKKAVRLSVEGAFHTRHMAKAAKEFRQFLKGFSFYKPKGTVFSNVYAGKMVDYFSIPDYLSSHILSPVRWKQEIKKIIESANVEFYEIGCGNTLSKLNRRIDRKIITKGLSNPAALSEVLS